MKILILTQYFPPEVGAPQNRLYEMAIRLQKKGADITVLTALPNYPQMKVYEGYKGKFRHYEEMNGLKVYRSWIFVKKSKSVFWRLVNYFSFACSSFWSGWFRLGKFDMIICESPPLFLGITAFLLKKIKGSKLLFNVSDLWPESAEKLGIVTNRFFLNISYRLENFLYRKSELITGQTQGIVNSIKSRFPEKEVYWIPNGVDTGYFDETKIHSEWRRKNNFSETDFIILYAGIIGHAYKFDLLMDASEALKEKKDIRLVIMGSGPEKDRLKKILTDKQLSNLHLMDTVSKSEMPCVLKAVNAIVIPLRKTGLSEGTIPSKIFEALAMKKPVLLGVEGESKKLFIEEGNCGLFFEPENSCNLVEKILLLYRDRQMLAALGENARTYVQNNFNRDNIADKFLTIIKTLCP